MPPTTPARNLLLFLALSLAPASAIAQPQAPSPAAPAPVDPITAPTPTPASAAPISPIGSSSNLLREGAFLSRVRGEMRRLSSGRWAFVFNPDLSGRRLPPMIILPSMNLAAMEQIVESRESAAFSVSGQVFVYQGRNYFMPTMHAYIPPEPPDAGSGAPPTPAPSADADPDTEAVSPDRAPGAEPTVEALIRELEEATPQRAETPAPVPAEGADPGLAREGVYLVLRRGRVSRSSAGEWVFLIDNGTTAPAGVDPPMTILPSLALAAIERVASDRSEGLNFVMSGKVYVYKGRNYILPTMHQVEPDYGNVLPAQ